MSNHTCIRPVDDACDCTACQLRRLVEDLTAEVKQLREVINGRQGQRRKVKTNGGKPTRNRGKVESPASV